MDHCISALRQMQKELTFRSYISDGLYALVNQTGQTYSTRFIDLVLPEEEEEDSGEDNLVKARKIQDRLKQKLGGNAS